MKEKITEIISIKLRKNLLSSRIKTLLLSAILLVAFLTLNLWIDKKDLPKFDITQNKIFTLSDASKAEISNINTDVSILIYGFAEDSSVVDFIKQYNKCNSKISYEFIDDDNNADIVKKYRLEKGNQAIVIKNGDNYKILYSSDFSSYDYTTFQPVDLTENAITNGLLNMTIAKKPKIYILTGHQEYNADTELSILLSYLENDVFDYSTLNLVTAGSVPEDCDLIAVLSPQNDLLDEEVNILQDYISKGGNIIFTFDYVSEEFAKVPNWQKVLDNYGLTVENGLIYETEDDYVVKIQVSSTQSKASPFVFIPHIEQNEITSKMLSDGGAVLLQMPRRITEADEEKQKELNVSYEDLLTSSEHAYFVSDFSKVAESEQGKSNIAVKATKTYDDNKESKAIVIANGLFVTNIQSDVASNYSQINLYNNADFILNSIANLTDREDTITVRKETSSATYAPTEKQHRIVVIIIFATPFIIIAIGIIVWNYRKHKR